MPGEAKHLTQVPPRDTVLTAAGSRALDPSGAPASSYNTLSRCFFVCLFFLLFLIFVAVPMNSSVLEGEAEMEQQQKIKLIGNTFQLQKTLGELKKENKQP